jgi:two-component system, NarL family, sensor histidine kinase EvgS
VPAPFFRAPALAASLGLGPEVLSPQERAFVAALPEVRVAIPLPAVRPFEVVDADGSVSGVHPEMLGYLAKAFRLRVRPVMLPSFADALAAMQDGRADLMMTLGYTSDRAKYLSYTLGVTPLAGALFTRVGATPPSSSDRSDLRHARFAVERNFLANDFLRREYPQATILTVETTGDALQAVAEGRATHYLGGLLTTIDWLTRQPVPGIEISRLMNYSTGYYHFAVRKDWSPLAGILNKGISTLRAQGFDPNRTDRAWGQAAASLPAGMPLPQPLRLTRPDLDLMIQRPVWRVGAVRGLPLLNQYEPDGTHSGIAAEMTEQVVRRLGVGLQLVPFDNVGLMLDALRRGDIDLIPFLTRTPDREREFAFSQAYVDMPYVIVARTDAPMYWDLDSLRGRRLALPAQHPLRPLLQKRYPDIQVVDVADGREAMDAVAAGRADASIEVKLFANFFINAPGGDALRTVAEVEEVPAQFHFASTRAGKGLIGLVDRALADVPEDEMRRIRRRWIAVDLHPPFPWRRWIPVIAITVGALLALAGLTAWWLRKLSKEVRERRLSEARLRDIGATLPCVAFRHLLSADGLQLVASWVSPRAVSLLGMAPDLSQTVVTSLAQRLPEMADAEALRADEQRCLQRGEPLQRTLAYHHPDGGLRWLTVEAVRTDAEAGLIAWTGTVVDTTAEHDLQARLLAAAESRNLMLASASHELRAPAHTLALALQALPAHGLSKAHDAALRIARDAVDTLSQLLGDVLDAARFDGAPLRLRPRDFDLRELLDRLAESAAATAASKGLVFVHDVDPNLPAGLHLDPLRVRQVVVNLLSNAFKYTPAGRVELMAVRRAATDGEPAMLAITVADSGPGIAPERRSRLFTPFAASAGATDVNGPAAVPHEGSSGLGLAISRQLAERMGGRLELASELGAGTRVTLLLPLVATTAEPASTTRSGVIVVCDDDPTSRVLLSHVLRGRGFVTEETDSAEAALARCAKGGVAAVITDLEMPGLGGVGLLRALRAGARPGLTLPALVVCSGDSADIAGSINTQGLADARLVKPVDLAALLRILSGLGVQAGA